MFLWSKSFTCFISPKLATYPTLAHLNNGKILH
jgi:hypothetical protein